MKIPQIPPLPGCTPLGVKPANELFDAPFNLRGEPLTSEIDAEGEARVRALAESEARKAQLALDWSPVCDCEIPFHDGKCLNVSRLPLSNLL